jgi:hypothetical protein
VLSVGGIALFTGYTPWIALAVGVLMRVVVASYRRNVHAYPSGGGDYEVSSTNLVQRVGLAVASADGRRTDSRRRPAGDDERDLPGRGLLRHGRPVGRLTSRSTTS